MMTDILKLSDLKCYTNISATSTCMMQYRHAWCHIVGLEPEGRKSNKTYKDLRPSGSNPTIYGNIVQVWFLRYLYSMRNNLDVLILFQISSRLFLRWPLNNLIYNFFTKFLSKWFDKLIKMTNWEKILNFIAKVNTN